MEYLINGSTLTNIGDAIREKEYSTEKFLPSDMANKIRNIKTGLSLELDISDNTVNEKWVRPSNWPDLDSISLVDFDGVYLTYDLSKTEGYGWIGIYVVTANSSAYTVERGHLSNGTFVADYSQSVVSGTYFREDLDDTYGDIQLWRVFATGQITSLGFATRTATNTNNLMNNVQPCVERVGQLPYVKTMTGPHSTGSTTICGGTIWLEHDAIKNVKSITSLANMWKNCYSLQLLELSGWQTDNVTTLSSTWQNCYSLKSLDLSSWNVAKVSTLSYAWQNCQSLEYLNCAGWIVTKVISLSYAWAGCYSLKQLDLTGWDPSITTDLSYTWQNCYSLQSLDISDWNVEKVSTMANTWYGCHSLKSLDIKEWVLSVCTNISYAWYQCYSLKSIDLSGWATPKITNITNAFRYCRALTSVNLSNWSATSQITYATYFFGDCPALHSVNLDGWDTSGLTSVSNLVPNIPTLMNFYPPIVAIAHSYNTANMLSVESLIRIINKLPTVDSTKTLTLGQTNKLKLTDVQIAIATEKGWTIA